MIELMLIVCMVGAALALAWPAGSTTDTEAWRIRLPSQMVEPLSAEAKARRRPLQRLTALLSRWLPIPPRDRAEGLEFDPTIPKPGRGALGAKVVLAAVFGVGMFIVSMRFGLPIGFPLMAAGIGFILPDIQARAKARARRRTIIRLLPTVVDLLTLCIGAGMDFLIALNRVISIKRFQGEPLIAELAAAMQEIKLGKRRAEALKAMAKRVDVQELSSFVRTIVQADRMGTPISDVLNVHAEDLRLERFMVAERAALKAPIKILFPLIFFIMPCVAIIVAAPIFIQFLKQNPFAK